jgi:hypothetical protein
LPYWSDEMATVLGSGIAGGRHLAVRAQDLPRHNGSVSVVRQLLAAGLVDELHLFQEPIAVRHGMQLFDESGTTIPLRLLSLPNLRHRCRAPRVRAGVMQPCTPANQEEPDASVPSFRLA